MCKRRGIESLFWNRTGSAWLANLDTWVEHIVHIDGVTGSSPVATTREPNPKGFGLLSILPVGKRVRRTVPVTPRLENVSGEPPRDT